LPSSHSRSRGAASPIQSSAASTRRAPVTVALVDYITVPELSGTVMAQQPGPGVQAPARSAIPVNLCHRAERVRIGWTGVGRRRTRARPLQRERGDISRRVLLVTCSTSGSGPTMKPGRSCPTQPQMRTREWKWGGRDEAVARKGRITRVSSSRSGALDIRPGRKQLHRKDGDDHARL
jgi:hypothetical protein